MRSCSLRKTTRPCGHGSCTPSTTSAHSIHLDGPMDWGRPCVHVGSWPKGQAGQKKKSDLAIERPYDRSSGRGALGCWKDPNLFPSAVQYMTECLLNVGLWLLLCVLISCPKIRKSTFCKSSFYWEELFISLCGSKVPSVIFFWLKNFNISCSTGLLTMNSISFFLKRSLLKAHTANIFAE